MFGVEGGRLKDRFTRLFSICECKEKMGCGDVRAKTILFLINHRHQVTACQIKWCIFQSFLLLKKKKTTLDVMCEAPVPQKDPTSHR